MRKSKVIEMLIMVMKKLHIKNKKLRFAIIAALGLLLGAVTQMDEGMFGKDIDKLPQTKTAVEKVVKEKAQDAASDIIGGLLQSIF